MRNDNGNILIMSIIIAALLIATAFAYFAVGSSERYEASYEEATMQAYFLAEQGIIEKGIGYLRTRRPSDLPTGTVYLPPKTEPGVGQYLRTHISKVSAFSGNDVFSNTNFYDIYSTGRVTFGLANRHEVERTKKLRVKLRSYSNYLYLTQIEETVYDEVIWFWGPGRDTLTGRVHSNDWIGMRGRPVFLGPISTCKPDFIHGEGYNPDFRVEPEFNVPPIEFPEYAQNIRANARPFIDDQNGRLMTRIGADGEAIHIWQYLMGQPFDPDNVISYRTIATPAWGSIFVNGQMELYGTVAGRCTFGSAENMWLIDNIKCASTNDVNGVGDNGTYDVIGLISEKNIIIKDNYQNGRDNSSSGNSIIINAAVVALNQSFTFEHQNDDWDAYQGPTPDERGTIYLWGSVAQQRRGYVHRSNHGGTGYNKSYVYDRRLDNQPPPHFVDAVDEQGFGLFDLIFWEELKPEK